MFEGHLWFAIPGDIDALTGGTLYDKRVIAELRARRWAVRHLPWAAAFPFPSAADLDAAGRDLAACPDGALVMIDGLAFGAMPDLALAQAGRLKLVALVHHPLALETGLSEALRAQLAALERRALAAARAVIATSDLTAGTLARDYGVDTALITVAKPGVDRPSRARTAKPPSATTRLLSIGSVVPRKGFDVLVEALASISDLDWRCVVAGSLERSPATAAALTRQIARLGLGERIALVGEQADLRPLYENADVFVLASRYEGYGMVLAEALTYGLPIVATDAGAIPEVVSAKAGILAPADDPAALAQALRAMITDDELSAYLVEGAALAGTRLPYWADSAARIASALRQIEDKIVRLR